MQQAEVAAWNIYAQLSCLCGPEFRLIPMAFLIYSPQRDLQLGSGSNS